jgi:predicted chitinase
MRSREFVSEAWPLAIGTAAAGFGGLQAYKQSQTPQQAPATAPIAPVAPVAAPKTAPVDAPAKPTPAKPAAEPTVMLPTNPKAQPLVRAAQKAGYRGAELAQFLAQMEHESWDFERLREVPQGKNYFRKYDIKYNPRQAQSLGNIRPGDGQRYHGRGYIQLTGRSNYQMAGDALGIDLINKPELAARPDVAAQIAVWYWNTRVKPNVRDFRDTATVTKYINPGLRGLQDRHANFSNYMKI